jgi:hypothetical protein
LGTSYGAYLLKFLVDGETEPKDTTLDYTSMAQAFILTASVGW